MSLLFRSGGAVLLLLAILRTVFLRSVHIESNLACQYQTLFPLTGSVKHSRRRTNHVADHLERSDIRNFPTSEIVSPA